MECNNMSEKGFKCTGRCKYNLERMGKCWLETQVIIVSLSDKLQLFLTDTDSRDFCIFWMGLDFSLIVDTKDRQSYIPLT